MTALTGCCVRRPRGTGRRPCSPFLFVRAVPGDLGGGRPIWPPVPCWESCDIHLLPSGAGGFDFSKTVLKPVAGQTYRVFVHVWNLGRFAAYGARLRAWWVEPGFFNGTKDPRYTPHFIGGTYFDLGDRDSGRSHQLIEVQPSWTVQMNQPAHECLIVAVDCATDPWDGSMDANRRRHVAQRNLNLVVGSDDLAPLVAQLGAMFGAGQQLVVAASSVKAADLTGAARRDLSSQRDIPHGWDHSALAPGPRTALSRRYGPDRTGRSSMIFTTSRSCRTPGSPSTVASTSATNWTRRYRTCCGGRSAS